MRPIALRSCSALLIAAVVATTGCGNFDFEGASRCYNKPPTGDCAPAEQVAAFNLEAYACGWGCEPLTLYSLTFATDQKLAGKPWLLYAGPVMPGQPNTAGECSNIRCSNPTLRSNGTLFPSDGAKAVFTKMPAGPLSASAKETAYGTVEQDGTFVVALNIDRLPADQQMFYLTMDTKPTRLMLIAAHWDVRGEHAPVAYVNPELPISF